MLPNTRLLARAFHRVPVAAAKKNASAPAASSITTRTFTSTLSAKKWEGSEPDAHITNEKDSHNVQIDAQKEAKDDRAKGEKGASKGTTEESGGANKKAKEEFPEAPDTIGMQDERGGKPRG